MVETKTVKKGERIIIKGRVAKTGDKYNVKKKEVSDVNKRSATSSSN